MNLTTKEDDLLSNILKNRYEEAQKSKVGDLEPGSIIITRWVDELCGGVEYGLLVTFRKNKDTTRCASLEGFDYINIDYVLKNTDDVVPLMYLEKDNYDR